jgi:hypothetical protein
MSKPLTISKKVVGIARGTAIQAGDTTKNQSISITKKQVQT